MIFLFSFYKELSIPYADETLLQNLFLTNSVDLCFLTNQLFMRCNSQLGSYSIKFVNESIFRYKLIVLLKYEFSLSFKFFSLKHIFTFVLKNPIYIQLYLHQMYSGINKIIVLNNVNTLKPCFFNFLIFYFQSSDLIDGDNRTRFLMVIRGRVF